MYIPVRRCKRNNHFELGQWTCLDNMTVVCITEQPFHKTLTMQARWQINQKAFRKLWQSWNLDGLSSYFKRFFRGLFSDIQSFWMTPKCSFIQHPMYFEASIHFKVQISLTLKRSEHQINWSNLIEAHVRRSLLVSQKWANVSTPWVRIQRPHRSYDFRGCPGRQVAGVSGELILDVFVW